MQSSRLTQRTRSHRPVRQRSVRGARVAPKQSGLGNPSTRVVVGRALLAIALVAAAVKLVKVQVFDADSLATLSRQQRYMAVALPGVRGSITDRNNAPLAFSVEARELHALPLLINKDWDKKAEEAKAKGRVVDNGDERKKKIAAGIKRELPEVDEQELLEKLRRNTSYVPLVNNVEPAKARAICKEFPELGNEYRELRQYPSGTATADLVGYANWRRDGDAKSSKLAGLEGLETSKDALLTGHPGRRVVGTVLGNNDAVIPNSTRVLEPPTAGSDIELTIDADVQFRAQQVLIDQVRSSGARGGRIAVLDSATGEVLALADDKPFDPNKHGSSTPTERNNEAITLPFEPGSVNKVITAAGAIEDRKVTPDTVLEVPYSYRSGIVKVDDAWEHGLDKMTATGIFAKSSNVGTLMLANEIGKERYWELLGKFGLGRKTEVGLAGESAGQLLPLGQWSDSTFLNVPIGQGLSMTVLQMAGLYQTIANDGLRVPPRIMRATTGPDKVRREEPRPEGIRVVSPETARTVRNMFRAVVQDVPGQSMQRGTGPGAALTGFQVAGKTGTAQQLDPVTKKYSGTLNSITFAGILPADNPRFVVSIMLDNPVNDKAAATKVFHEVGSYLTQRFQLPVSPEPSPFQQLIIR